MNESQTGTARPAIRIARGWPASAVVSIALIGAVAVVHAADSALLGMEAYQPGFLASLRVMLAGGLVTLWGGFVALVLCWRHGSSRALLAGLLLAACGARLGAELLPARYDRHAALEAVQVEHDIDPAAWARAAVSLGRRVIEQVPEEARVAIVHRQGQPDFPLFLAYALCPRVFFGFAGEEPTDEVLRELGITWVLDVRQTSANREYREAVLRRTAP